MPSSYQVVLWKQERFVVLRPLQIEFFRSLLGRLQNRLSIGAASALRLEIRTIPETRPKDDANACLSEARCGFGAQCRSLAWAAGAMRAGITSVTLRIP
jgi:hypothetical protein